MSKVKVDALLKKDLEEYISNLGLSSELKEGKIPCEICKEPLSKESIGAIYYIDHVPKFTCRKMLCYQEIDQYNKDK